VIHLTQNAKIFVAVQPLDFRKQIDGITAYCKHQLNDNPRSGAWFVFRNRSNTMIRLLHYDGSGYWLATKRLSQGRYQGWPEGDQARASIAASDLMRLLKSITCEEQLKRLG